jgi:hypothetical protein
MLQGSTGCHGQVQRVDAHPPAARLPDNPYPLIECVAVKVGKNPYVRFDLNDYSVPHAKAAPHVLADPYEVRVLDGAEVLACHRRSSDKGRPRSKTRSCRGAGRRRAAHRHRGTDRLSTMVHLAAAAVIAN